MKILFICGSLEPGCDGVGDYTTRLAQSLIEDDHQVAILALYDKFIKEFSISSIDNKQKSISVCRIPYETDHQKRTNSAHSWISEINPEVISLQYVPYSFHSKGLPFKLVPLLNNISGSSKWQIMFHELWLGINKGSTVKENIIGKIQKRIVISLIKKLKPVAIHTQSQIYFNQLYQLRANPQMLPLFGNIEYIPLEHDSKKTNVISFAIFGKIRSGSPIESFAKELADYAKVNKKNMVINIIGRAGNYKYTWIKICQSYGLEVEDLGEQPPDLISKVLQHTTYGISTTPLPLVEKSGAVAAMREHGLPVITVAHQWIAKEKINFTMPEGVFNYEKGNLAGILSSPIGSDPLVDLSDIKRQFMDCVFTPNKH
ncbi:MAG: hypothetical protein ACNS62_07875 [Candidatus Cyclobacteriaceae bacterium M3_2C_046]